MQPSNRITPDEAPGGGVIGQVWCFLVLALQGMLNNRFQVILTAVTMGVGSLGLALTIFIGQGALDGIWADVTKLVGSWVVINPDYNPHSKLMRQRAPRC